MEAFQAIRGFLGAVRARLRAVSFTTGGARAGAALLVLLLVAPLAAWLVPEHAGAARVLTILALVAAVPVFVALAVVLPRRRTRSDVAVARYVGARVPGLTSDLLSAVELEREIGATVATPRFSRELTLAFAGATAERLAPLRPVALVPTA